MQCNWDIQDDAPPIETPSKAPPQPPSDPLQPSDEKTPVRISYLTEQTSHHPPVSAYFMECPARGITARGYDQLSAKFTGTAVRVVAGNYNQGIFVQLAHRDNEEYQLTHPAANLGGLLRGALAISVSDTCFITCPKTGLKAILTYLEEGWVGKAQNKMTGIVFRYDPDNDKYTKIKDVPEKEILARVEGCWQEQIYYWIPSNPAVQSDKTKATPTTEKQLLIDLVPLMPVPKTVPPPEDQLSNESRRFWQELTAAMTDKRFGDANKVKQDIEQRQRDKAAERKKEGKEWTPRFFTRSTESNGRPELAPEGRRLLDGMQRDEFHLEEAETPAS